LLTEEEGENPKRHLSEAIIKGIASVARMQSSSLSSVRKGREEEEDDQTGMRVLSGIVISLFFLRLLLLLLLVNQDAVRI